MGFLDKLKGASRHLRHVEVEMTAEKFADVWEELSKFHPRVKLNPRSKVWDDVKEVRIVEKEVGLFKKSTKRVVEIGVYEYETEEDEYLEYPSSVVWTELNPEDKVVVSLSQADYERVSHLFRR